MKATGEVHPQIVPQEEGEVCDMLGNASSTELGGQVEIYGADLYRGKMREQQKKRAEQVTKLLENYTEQQAKRNAYKQESKPKIVSVLIVLVFILTLGIIASIILGIILGVDALALGALISGCVTYLSSIIALFLIIVKYLFPENEEANFNDLVKSIISNDTERMKSENENGLEVIRKKKKH